MILAASSFLSFTLPVIAIGVAMVIAAFCHASWRRQDRESGGGYTITVHHGGEQVVPPAVEEINLDDELRRWKRWKSGAR